MISLPKIKKNFEMNFFPWSTKQPLEINKFGIPEPTSNKIVFPNILLVPSSLMMRSSIELVMVVDFMIDI